MGIAAFLRKLKEYSGESVFNPWRDYDAACDIGAEAPELRSANLKRYLELRPKARYLFVAEALGYQGGHFSGIAITSERILLGQHPDIDARSVLGDWEYRRTSNPASPLLSRSQREKGFNEPTDTVVWNALAGHGLAPFEVVLWNIFPFHPYRAGNILSNRTPDRRELDIGVEYTRMLLAMYPGIRVVAIGRKAAATLAAYGTEAFAVPHPSMGGAERFRRAVAALFAGDAK